MKWKLCIILPGTGHVCFSPTSFFLSKSLNLYLADLWTWNYQWYHPFSGPFWSVLLLPGSHLFYVIRWDEETSLLPLRAQANHIQKPCAECSHIKYGKKNKLGLPALLMWGRLISVPRGAVSYLPPSFPGLTGNIFSERFNFYTVSRLHSFYYYKQFVQDFVWKFMNEDR